MKLHCDSCGYAVGDNFEVIRAKGHRVGRIYTARLPDIICSGCIDEGYSVERPKDPIKVYGREYKSYPPKIADAMYYKNIQAGDRD